MTGIYYPAVRTVVTPDDALDCLWHAHQEVLGGPCETELLVILAAQSAFETANWKSMWCWNWGNIGGHGPGGGWTNIMGAGEIIDGKAVPRANGEAGAFAVWPDKMSGARGYVAFLGTASHPPMPNRYQPAWDAAKVGDLHGFVVGIKAGDYMTDGIEHYAKGLEDRRAWLRRDALPRFLDRLTAEPDRLADTDPAPPPESSS